MDPLGLASGLTTTVSEFSGATENIIRLRAALPRPGAAASVPGSVDEALGGALGSVCGCNLAHAGGYPRLRLIGDVAKEFDLDLIRRMESVSRAISLVQGAKGVGANPMEVEIVAAVDSTRSVRAAPVCVYVAWPMTSSRTVVPIAFREPAMPAFMHEVASTRRRICVEHVGVKEVAGKRNFVVARPVISEATKDAGRVGRVVVNGVLEVAVGRLCQLPVVGGAVKRLIVVVEQAVSHKIGRIPGFRVLEIVVTCVIPTSIAPIV